LVSPKFNSGLLLPTASLMMTMMA